MKRQPRFSIQVSKRRVIDNCYHSRSKSFHIDVETIESPSKSTMSFKVPKKMFSNENMLTEQVIQTGRFLIHVTPTKSRDDLIFFSDDEDDASYMPSCETSSKFHVDVTVPCDSKEIFDDLIMF